MDLSNRNEPYQNTILDSFQTKNSAEPGKLNLKGNVQGLHFKNMETTEYDGLNLLYRL